MYMPVVDQELCAFWLSILLLSHPSQRVLPCSAAWPSRRRKAAVCLPRAGDGYLGVVGDVAGGGGRSVTGRCRRGNVEVFWPGGVLGYIAVGRVRTGGVLW